MPHSSVRLALPYIQPSQAQKHVTHNEALRQLDVLVQLGVQALDAITPPALPVEGGVWALGAAPDGAWAGHGHALALWDDAAWHFTPLQEGWCAVLLAAGTLHLRRGGAWQVLAGEALENLDGIGIGTTSDATNRLAVAAEASLFSHAGAGHQVKVNKNSAADTASLLFQSGWSGRAEMGLAGNDDFAVKVSADGSAWTTALAVAGATGKTSLSGLRLIPGPAPASPMTGDLYCDSSTQKLRFYDGTVWHDLF